MKHINVDRPPRPGIPRLPFSDAVEANGTVYFSGRIGLDPQTHLPPADAGDEARLLMDDFRNVVAAAGLRMQDVVSVQIFTPDVTLFGAFNAIYLSYFGENLPARAFLGSGPLLFGARFELCAIGVRP